MRQVYSGWDFIIWYLNVELWLSSHGIEYCFQYELNKKRKVLSYKIFYSYKENIFPSTLLLVDHDKTFSDSFIP